MGKKSERRIEGTAYKAVPHARNLATWHDHATPTWGGHAA